MPDYVNTTTLELYRSTWPQPAGATEITRAEYDAAALIPVQYRKWVDPDIVEMTQPEKDAVDAAEAAQTVTDNRATAVSDVDDTDMALSLEIRALINAYNKRCNYLVNRVEELQQDMLGMKAASNAAGMRAAIRASYLATNTRNLPTARQDYKDDINAGEVDS